MDTDTSLLLEASLAGLFSQTSGPAALARLDELGWAEVAAAEPEPAAALLFAAQGRALVTTPALDLVVLAAFGPHIPSGSRALHPHPAAPVPGPGVGAGAPSASTPTPGAGRDVRGVAFGPVGDAPLVVPTTVGDAVVAVLIEHPDERFEMRPVEGMAPEMGLVEVSGTLPDGPAGPDVSAHWGPATAAARRALAYELNAVTGVMLAQAVEHACQREQFGQPIGGFQAVQHRLADVHVALQAARIAAGDAGETGHEMASSAAKALAGKAFRSAARHCQQVLGAIGFTWEHPFHFALRRGMVLEVLYGGAVPITRELGLALRAGGSRPFLVPLSAPQPSRKAGA